MAVTGRHGISMTSLNISASRPTCTPNPIPSPSPNLALPREVTIAADASGPLASYPAGCALVFGIQVTHRRTPHVDHRPHAQSLLGQWKTYSALA